MLKKIENNKKLQTILILVALIVVVAIVAALYIRGKYSHRMDIDGYQMVYGMEVPIEKGVRITIKDDVIECSNGNSVDRTPIYSHKKKNYAVLVPMFSVVQPYKNEAPKRLLPFTEIRKKENAYIMKRGSNSAILDYCFLYDGEDTYVFVDEVPVSYGEELTIVSPLSFVYAPYNQPGYIYDYDSGSYIEIPQGSTVTAQFDKKYSIYLNTDRIESSEGGMLLHRNVNDLNKYK